MSSQTWIRGPVCGTDNCRSRLWRILAGRRTCQFGHVMEGDVEFNDDEDEVQGNVITRRLNLTTSATGQFTTVQGSQSVQDGKIKKLYGTAGEELFLLGFQQILKKQCRWICDHHAPKEFETAVKRIWKSWLVVYSSSSKLFQSGNSQFESQETVGARKNQLTMVHSLVFMYIAARQLRLPIYFNDFLKWIASGELCYFKASHSLPEEMRQQLANYYMKELEPGRIPTNGILYLKLAHVSSMLDIKLYLPYETLLLQLIKRYCLPYQIYFYVKNYVDIQHVTFECVSHSGDKHKRMFDYPELKLASLIIFVCKLHAMDGMDEFNWLKWMQEEDAVTKEKRDTQLLKTASTSSTAKELEKWSAKRTEQYMDWVAATLVPMNEKEKDERLDDAIAKRRLLGIFTIQVPEPNFAQDDAVLRKKYHELTETNLEKFDMNQVNELEFYMLEIFAIEFGVSEQQLYECTRSLQNQVKKF